MQHTHKTLSFKLFYYYLLCILTSIWLLRAPKSWLKHFFQPFSSFFVQKNISTSVWVCAAPKSWSKYTIIIVSNKSQKPINVAEPMLSWPKLIEKPWIERELLKWQMIERRSTQIFDAHFYGQILFAESNMHRNIFCCICKTAAKTLLLLKTSWEGWFGGHSKSGSCQY